MRNKRYENKQSKPSWISKFDCNIYCYNNIYYPIIILLVRWPLGGVLGAGAAGGAMELLGGGVILVLVAPLIYGVLTWIFTIFYALVLNLALKWSGGLQVDTSE